MLCSGGVAQDRWFFQNLFFPAPDTIFMGKRSSALSELQNGCYNQYRSARSSVSIRFVRESRTQSREVNGPSHLCEA
jgi:hypothetical protein